MSKEDTQEQIGKLIPAEAHKDAIHIAVAPAIAAVSLRPGQHIGFEEDGRVGPVKDLIGIVDPFLAAPIGEGDRFYLFLYPNTITGLHHEWTHPAFSGEPRISQDKAISEAWLREFCSHADCPGYEIVMQGIQGQIDHDDDYGNGGYKYLHFNGSDAHGVIPHEFWVHAEIVLGKKLPHHAEYFSCSC